MIERRLASFRCALNGLGRMFRSQTNARIHLVATGLVIAAGALLRISIAEWCLVTLAIAAVLAAEAFNTALEELTDLVSPGQHPLAGRAKDSAAGAVLVTAIGAAFVGGLVFLPRALG